MKIDGYKNLTDMARNAKMDPETVAKFRNAALQSVDNAIDVFFKPEREVSEGKQAYDDLTDLERAMRAYSGRLNQETTDNVAGYSETVRGLCPKASSEEVGAGPSILPNGKPLENGVRKFGEGYANNSGRAESRIGAEKNALTQLVDKMTDIFPLYGSVAMVPGPLSVSLKDHLKEKMQWSTQGNSSSSSRSETDSFRLLTLSAGKKRIQSSSSASVSGAGKAETMTVDERVMPGMHEIRNSIAALGFCKENKANYKVTQEVLETDRRTETEGVWVWKKEVTREVSVNRGSHTAAEGSLTIDPSRMAIYSVNDNQGLEKPGAGAELVDLVAHSELTPEFVDSFRDKAQNVLDEAVSTLFNTKREVSDGRKSYDQLANLERSLQFAQNKFGDKGYGPNPLKEQIENLKEVTPLYACVAMVPGEMSSSVKSHAKSMFEDSLSVQSSGASRGHEVSGSLLTLGLSETNSSASESSDFSKQFKSETTTTDELIMPKLHGLKVRLDQMQLGYQGDKAVLFIPEAPKQSTRNGYY